MRKLLIVVDYQIDFVTGALGFEGAVAICDCIQNKIGRYRADGDEIVFTYDTHDENYLNTQEGRNLPVAHCIKGTPGWELVPAIEALREPDDRCFCKPSFGSAELFEYLRIHPYESIELCGVVTDICVVSNAVVAKTAQPETPVVVDASCVASNNPARGEAALDVLRSVQVIVLDAAQ